MLKYIERLREESEKTRRRYAFGLSLFVVLIIAGAWTANRIYLSSLPADSQIVNDKNPSPVQSVVSTFSEGYDNVKKAITATPWNSLPANSKATSTPLVSTTTPEKTGEVIIMDVAN